MIDRTHALSIRRLLPSFYGYRKKKSEEAHNTRVDTRNDRTARKLLLTGRVCLLYCRCRHCHRQSKLAMKTKINQAGGYGRTEHASNASRRANEFHSLPFSRSSDASDKNKSNILISRTGLVTKSGDKNMYFNNQI